MYRLTTATPAITAAYATSAPNARMNPYSMPIHSVDAMLEHIEGFNFARGGGVIVRKVARGYTRLSERTGAPHRQVPAHRQRRQGKGALVERRKLGASGPFGVATMPLDQALDYVTNEPDFWTHA